MAIPTSYNLRNVIQRPTSTLTTTVGIALVVAILIGAFALASGFQAALTATGSPANVIALRTGADSEIAGGIGRDAANVLRSLPEIATGPDDRPLASAEMVVLINSPRLGQSGSSNVMVRGIDPSGLTLRSQVKIVAGRMFTPGSDEVIVGGRIARRFAHCAIGDRLKLGQREFAVVGHFDAQGSGFESEVWGDNAVLMPALNRNDVFQSVTFRMKDPSEFQAIRS